MTFNLFFGRFCFSFETSLIREGVASFGLRVVCPGHNDDTSLNGEWKRTVDGPVDELSKESGAWLIFGPLHCYPSFLHSALEEVAATVNGDINIFFRLTVTIGGVNRGLGEGFKAWN